MKSATILAGVVVISVGVIRAQPLTVYSEFAVLDAQARVIAPDTPREILSPAVPRNAFSTFQIAIEVEQEKQFILRVGLNPENAVKVTLYRQLGAKSPSGSEILQPLPQQWTASGPQVVWMDLWVDKDAPVRRIKVEPQLYVDGDWAIYPMEVRVREPQALEAPPQNSGRELPAYSVLHAHLCGEPLAPLPTQEMTVNALHFRNATEDVQLYDQLDPADRVEFKKRFGECSAKEPKNPEFYLRLRDYFFTPVWMKVKEGH